MTAIVQIKNRKQRCEHAQSIAISLKAV